MRRKRCMQHSHVQQYREVIGADSHSVETNSQNIKTNSHGTARQAIAPANACDGLFGGGRLGGGRWNVPFERQCRACVVWEHSVIVGRLPSGFITCTPQPYPGTQCTASKPDAVHSRHFYRLWVHTLCTNNSTRSPPDHEARRFAMEASTIAYM